MPKDSQNLITKEGGCPHIFRYLEEKAICVLCGEEYEHHIENL